jgi:hypothetical protein
MRAALRLAFLCVILLSGLALACGDDDDDDDSDGTTTPTPAASRLTSTPRPTDGDEKTPGPSEDPDGGEETPRDTSTPPPTATTGTPAPRIEDVSTFFAQFPTPPQDERQCAYNPSTRVIDCSDRGLYAPDPPPVGQDIQCFFMASGGNPAVVRCEIAEPQGAAYYDVRG